MFYLTDVEDYVRVDPKLFGLPTSEAVVAQLEETYSSGFYEKDMGQAITVVNVEDIAEGVIIPGDGAAYYKCNFTLLVWKPEMQELVFGRIDEITNFGAFINLGVMKGMIHISQTMEDYVSFSDAGSLAGKSSGRALKNEDLCLARIVAISHKGDDPKIGLTMRQPGLGKLEWIKEDKAKKEAEDKKIVAAESKLKGGKNNGKK